MKFLVALFGFVLFVSSPALAGDHHHRPVSGAPGLEDTTILIIRHAEDADRGPGLSAIGERRARAYARYFRPFRLGQESLWIDTLVAAADSRHSLRPRLTLEPLSQASGLPIQQQFEDRDVKDLALWLAQGPPRRTILIAWRHSDIPKLIAEFGLDPHDVLHRNRWSGEVYDQIVLLRFDHTGTLIPGATRLISEGPLQLH